MSCLQFLRTSPTSICPSPEGSLFPISLLTSYPPSTSSLWTLSLKRSLCHGFGPRECTLELDM